VKQKKFDDKNKKAHPSKRIATVYFVLRISVIIVMIRQIIIHNYYNAAMCVFTLFLFLIPSIVDKRLHIKLPNALEIVILLFIFSAEILGEIHAYYLIFDQWDTMLHTINGFMMAAIGFAMIDILNQHDKFHITMTPIFVALVAFCFSMTIGVLWEFYEFSVDMIFQTDMQKDTWIDNISSVAINPANTNVPDIVTVKSFEIVDQDGKIRTYIGKTIDIGLIDTMNDLIVNCIGAIVFSILGFFYIKGREKSIVFRSLIPTLKSPAEIEMTKIEESGKRVRKKVKNSKHPPHS